MTIVNPSKSKLALRFESMSSSWQNRDILEIRRRKQQLLARLIGHEEWRDFPRVRGNASLNFGMGAPWMVETLAP